MGLYLMRKLGNVLHISHRGFIILRTSKTPPIGARVVDKRVQDVGIIQDVFGPVKTPYVAIRPKKTDSSSKFVGQPLYLYKK